MSVPLPKVLIRPAAFAKLQAYIDLCEMEISGLGSVELVGNDLLVTDLFILEQQVSPGATELDAAQISNFLIQLVMDGRDPADLKLWWHSHVRMPAFWSETDEHTAINFGNDWMLSIVGNKFGDYRCRLDIYKPEPVTLDGLELRVVPEPDKRLRDSIEQEIKRKVRLYDDLHDLPVPSDVGDSAWGGQWGHNLDD
jgi:proteasome lid subunit RPN8/RPN11